MNMYKQKLRAFVTDRNGKIVVAQTPNIPLIGWLLLLLGSWWVSAEPWHDALAFFSAAFLFTWAWLELTQGVSPVRRVFGAMVLVYLLVRAFIPAE